MPRHGEAPWIRDGRLHDARHTAATVLLLLGVSERTIMGVMRKLVDERGVSVIVATHDPLLIGMGDHIVHLHDGAVQPGEDIVVSRRAEAQS